VCRENERGENTLPARYEETLYFYFSAQSFRFRFLIRAGSMKRGGNTLPALSG